MEQRISMITLGVQEIARSRAFYEALNWKADSSSNEHVTFFSANGLVLGLFGLSALAEEASGGEIGEGFGRVALAYNTRSENEVDKILKQAQAAGGTLVKKAAKVFWGGYSGYFADPDGHRWEVAYNPHWTVTKDGHIKLEAEN